MEQTLPENGFFEKVLDKSKKSVIIALVPAGVAHPVERHLAKVEVASSSLVTRSIKPHLQSQVWFFISPGRISPGCSSAPEISQAEGEGKNSIPKEI